MKTPIPEDGSTSKMNNIAEPDRKIIMAVDFGTTYSGLAWVQTRKPEIQTPIIQWPDATSGGLEGITSDKVPTEIAYNGEDFKWGFQIDDAELRRQWFKLSLDASHHRRSDLAVAYPDSTALPSGRGPSPEQMVTDYLSALRKHAEQILRYKLPAGALQSTPLEFVITVPAVWTDGAQAKTRACAEKAGMGLGSALHIISEPEAAAIWGHLCMVDAGGGTVDLISYTVTELRPTLKVVEASPGSGSLCGSSFLNRIFQKTLREIFKDDPTWDDDVLEEASKRFETVIKRQFRGTANEEFQIPVPGLRDNLAKGVRRGRLRMGGAEVEAIFRPVIQEVISLVLGQIKATSKAVSAVLLVGGFGQSAYLRDQIRAAVGEIEVMQSPNSWTAVVRGALMKGLASSSAAFAKVGVSGRSARKHYGIESHKEYESGKHLDSLKYFDKFYQGYRVLTMDWFIKKGLIVQEHKPLTLEYYKVQNVSYGRPNEMTLEIYVCCDPMNSGAPQYRDSQVAELVQVKADLRRVPKQNFPEEVGRDGQRYFRINFQVQVTYFSAYTKYELIHGGINYGTVAAEYV